MDSSCDCMPDLEDKSVLATHVLPDCLCGSLCSHDNQLCEFMAMIVGKRIYSR